MKISFISKALNSLRLGGSLLVLSLLFYSAQAQQNEHKNVHVRSGQKAILDGDFKSASQHLNKALETESSDPNVVYLLGYSQFQAGEYQLAASAFEKVIKLDPANATAYYYKGKANNNLAVNTESKLNEEQRAKLLGLAIADYSKAIELDKTDAKLYQNRGLAYRDLGILNGTSGMKNYNKKSATDAYNGAIADFEKVLSFDATRKDIQTELKKAKVYRDNLK